MAVCNSPLGPAGCIADDIVNGIGDVGNSIGGAISFAQDPFGATLKALRDGVHSLTSDVLPVLTTAIQPDLSAEFFLNAYRISFAAAVFVMVLLLMSLFVRTGRGDMAGRELVQAVAFYTPLFLIGAMFGPLAGIMLVNLFHALAESVIAWGTAGQAQAIIDGLLALTDRMDPAAVPGGVILAIILMLLMLVGLLFVLIILLCQLVTLYFTGVIVPLFLALLIDPARRQAGLRYVGLWVGILAAHPLLFFFLGFAFSIMGGSINTFGAQGKNELQTLVTFIVALIAIYIAAFSPLLLMKFAPLIPAMASAATGGGGGGRSSGGDNNTVGPSSVTDATNQYGSGGRESSSESSSTNTTTTTESKTSSTSESTTDPTLTNTDTPSGEPETPVGARTGAGSGATAAEGAGGAEAGATGLAEAGAAESGTGAGAAIGIPTLAAAAAVAAAEKAKETGDKAASHAVAPMDDTSLDGS